MTLFAYLTFFLFPVVLWLLGSWVLYRGDGRRWSTIVAGLDGRLSLSRLQATAWTLVLFGSYAAAMLMHPLVGVFNAEQRKAIEEQYTKATAAHVAAETALADRNAALAAAQAQVPVAHTVMTEAAEDLKALPADASDALKKQRQDALAAARAEHLAAVRKVTRTVHEIEAARNIVGQRVTEQAAAKREWRRTKWVEIPNELLALAGISLAAGVFASVISASANRPTPEVSTLAGETNTALLPSNVQPANATWLRISGKNFGAAQGEVRLDGKPVKTLSWTDTVIDVDTGPVPQKDLTVDTGNGKLTYVVSQGVIQQQIPKSDWGDLFRDDDHPAMFSLMKFQMFGWTAIALFIYCWIFLSALRCSMDTLPVVDSTVVLLTGLSQGGYLGGKAASTMGK